MGMTFVAMKQFLEMAGNAAAEASANIYRAIERAEESSISRACKEIQRITEPMLTRLARLEDDRPASPAQVLQAAQATIDKITARIADLEDRFEGARGESGVFARLSELERRFGGSEVSTIPARVAALESSRAPSMPKPLADRIAALERMSITGESDTYQALLARIRALEARLFPMEGPAPATEAGERQEGTTWMVVTRSEIRALIARAIATGHSHRATELQGLLK